MKEDYIVYGAFDENGICLYVGEGKPDRYKHITSGVSHVYEANRWHFKEEVIVVEILHTGLTKDEARTKEKVEINARNPAWNKATPNKVFGTKVENFAIDRFRTYNKERKLLCGKKRKYETIIRDICALLNTNGATLLMKGQKFSTEISPSAFLYQMSARDSRTYPALKHVFDIEPQDGKSAYLVQLRCWGGYQA